MKHLKEELNQLTSLFRGIGYKEKDIRKPINRAKGFFMSEKHKGPQGNFGRVFLPYIKGVTHNIAKVMRRKDIFTLFSTT